MVDNSKPIRTTNTKLKEEWVKYPKRGSGATFDTEKKELRDNVAGELITALASPAPKAAINIEYPALHPIATGWSNTSSIHSYEPEEFVSSITSVHDKQSILVYDVLKTFREGSNLKKTSDNQKPIADLMLDPDKHNKIEEFFHQLKSVLDPPKKLSVPYSINDFNKRKQPLVNRITQLYPDQLDAINAVYKATNGFHGDNNDIVRYPFVFEIVAIRFNNNALEGSNAKPTEFIGFVNYSTSPKSNKFEGDYKWYDKEWRYPMSAHDIIGFLEHLKFEFSEYCDSKTKIPCIIVANLVSPRIDYQGHDKSCIDIAPFIETILSTVTKMAEGIRTFRGAGYTFHTKYDHELIASNANKKITTEQLLSEFQI